MAMKTVAIACQGGGSHTAFTAGVLAELLRSPHYGKDFTITALSGTSGGALCAGLVWAKLLRGPHEQPADRHQAAEAAKTLTAFWKDLAADERLLWEPWMGWTFNYVSALSNRLMVDGMRFNPFAEQECRQLSRISPIRMLSLLERHIPVAELRGKAFKTPALRLGATDIRAGMTEPLAAEDHAPEELHKLLLASASIPPLFPPTVVDKKSYWDGLYSHNPPLDCLVRLKPQEIWVIRINPEHVAHAPRTPRELVDRRNELMGNLSLLSELYHIEAMNRLLHSSKVGPAAKKDLRKLYKPIKLRMVYLHGELDFASKYDRSLTQMEQLMEQGRQEAHKFFSPKSLWTRGKEPGLHNALLDPHQPQHNGHAVAAEEPHFAYCNTLNCPAIGVCNGLPLTDLGVECAFKMGQKYLELKT